MTKTIFIRTIRRWYRRNKQRFNFPWRRTRDPYEIFVSEMMLQQTQISRVLPKYEEWLKEFPTIQHLASAPFPMVLRTWHGLGYNRRARYLKNAAGIIMCDYGGRVPAEPAALEKLPGIGHYTSRAVACFTHGACEPFLDTNIRRVFLHFFKPHSLRRMGDKELIGLIQHNSPARPSRKWYYALMDYGREALGKKQENPNRAWRGYAKQSRFKGSRRYVRARIIALLLARRGAGVRELRERLAGESAIRPHLTAKPFRAILASLERDGLIRQQGTRWVIAQT